MSEIALTEPDGLEHRVRALVRCGETVPELDLELHESRDGRPVVRWRGQELLGDSVEEPDSALLSGEEEFAQSGPVDEMRVRAAAKRDGEKEGAGRDEFRAGERSNTATPAARLHLLLGD